jgi:RimJ/RimL family protein N-acetyltransferase
MSLCYREIALRPVYESDLPFLFRLLGDPNRVHLWMRGRPVYDEANFQQAWSVWTSSMIAAKFIVESAGRPAGLVFDYDRMLDDGFTKSTTLLDEEFVGAGVGATASVLFWDWLFRSFPFRKVYFDVFGYNPTVLRLLRRIGLVEEGVLKADRYWNGRYWDTHILALYREAMPKHRKRVFRDAEIQPHAAAEPTPTGNAAPRVARIPSNGCLSGAD